MYKNILKRRWEATKPEHLIGWTIVRGSQDVDQGSDMVKVVMVSNTSHERRECWVKLDIIPVEVTQKDYYK